MSALDDAQEEVTPDMTPMIDVVFQLLVFFINLGIAIFFFLRL